MTESEQLDKKSLLCFARPEKIGWRDLAKDCVAFANTRGGDLLFGIEDAESEPKPNQRIDPALINSIQKNIASHTIAVGLVPKVVPYPNGGEVLHVHVHPSRQQLAATTDGRYFYRVGDQSTPIPPDQLPRLLAEKEMYVWEIQTVKKVPRDHVDEAQLTDFIRRIKQSDRVSVTVREKSAPEILDHYFLTDGDFLTNLGILWIGLRRDRAQLLYAPVVQFLKHDAQGNKIGKKTWDDYSLNPLQLIEAVWTEFPAWSGFDEFPDGLFRKQIPHYDEVVIRELVANALVHRPYTTAGDIFINLHPDHLEIHNPGRFPLGVNSANILHQSVRRNDHLAKVFHDLKLMEREGSGYDKIYETQLLQGKPLPEPEELDDRIVVTVRRDIVKPDILDFLTKASAELDLSQRERIALGLVAQRGSLTALEFSRILDLKNEDTRIRSWLGNLESRGVIVSKGKTRGKTYAVNPEVLRTMDFRGKTTLRNIESHRLRELLLVDLKTYGPTASESQGIESIHERIGSEISRKRVKEAIDELREAGLVGTTGERRGMAYYLSESGSLVFNAGIRGK